MVSKAEVREVLAASSVASVPVAPFDAFSVPVMVPFLRAAENYDRNIAGNYSALDCAARGEDGVSRTQQQFREEADINTIVKRFGLTGVLPQGVRMPTYEDFSESGDFREAMNAVVAANEAFDALPADVRYRFANDPARLVDFCSDPSNLDEARRLGLVPASEALPGARGSIPPAEPAPAVPMAPAGAIAPVLAPTGGSGSNVPLASGVNPSA